MLKVFFYLQGLIGPLVRLNEPAFRTSAFITLKEDFFTVFFCLKEKEEDQDFFD